MFTYETPLQSCDAMKFEIRLLNLKAFSKVPFNILSLRYDRYLLNRNSHRKNMLLL